METPAEVHSSKRRKEDEYDSANQSNLDGFEIMIKSDEPVNLDQSENTFDAFKQLEQVYMKERYDRFRDIEVKYNELKPKCITLEIEYDKMKKKNDALESDNKSLKVMHKAVVLKHTETKNHQSENSTETSKMNDSNSEPCSRCDKFKTEYSELQRDFTNLDEKYSMERNNHIKEITDIRTEARTKIECKCKEIAEVTAEYGKLDAEHNKMSSNYKELQNNLELTKKSGRDLEKILQKEQESFKEKYKELEDKQTIYLATKMTPILQEQTSKLQDKCREYDELKNKHLKQISILAEQSKDKMASMESSFYQQKTKFEEEHKELSNLNSDLKRRNEELSTKVRQVSEVDNIEFENICKTKDELETKNQELKSEIIDLREWYDDKITELKNGLTSEKTKYEQKCNEFEQMKVKLNRLDGPNTDLTTPDAEPSAQPTIDIEGSGDFEHSSKEWNELAAKCHKLESENSTLRKQNDEAHSRIGNRQKEEETKLAETCKKLEAEILQHQGLKAEHSELLKQHDAEIAKYNFAESSLKIAEEKYGKRIKENEQSHDEITAQLIRDRQQVERERDDYRNKANLVNTGGGHHSNSKETELAKKLEELEEQHTKMVTIFQDKIKSLREKNRDVINEKENLSHRLAEEWSEKVSSDESNIENVSIKNRPMTIADEMQQLLNTEWLEAKGDIDSVGTSTCEMEKRRFLCEILVTAEKHAKEYLTVIIEGIFTQMFHALWDPFNLPNSKLGLCDKSNQPSQDSGVKGGDEDNEMDYGQKDQQTENAGTSNKSHEDKEASYLDRQNEHNKSAQTSTDKNTIHPKTDKEMKQFQSIVIRDQLKNGMRDFLRMRADDINTASLVKKIEDKFHGYAVMVSIKGNANFTSYLLACSKLAWKMVIQSPAMEFDVKGLGEKYNPNRHEPSYDSENPNDASSKIQYYVHPTLLHANKVMVKGKVHIKKTHEQ